MVQTVSKVIAPRAGSPEQEISAFDDYMLGRDGGAVGVLPEGMEELGHGDDMIADLLANGQAFEMESGAMDFEDKINAFKALMDKVNKAFAERVNQAVDEQAGKPRFKE